MKFFDDVRPLLAGALICGAGIGVISNSGGLFLRPVCDSLGISRAEFAAVSSISLLGSMITAVFYGKRLKRGRIRPLLICSAAVCCAVSAGYSFCGRVWQFYLLAAVNGLAVNGITMLTASAVAAESRFGGALSVGTASAGAGIVSALFLTPLSQIIERFGWRWGYRFQAGAALLLLAGAILLVEERNSVSAEKEVLPFKADKGFVLLCGGLFSANFVNMSLFCNTAAFFADIGFSAQRAAWAISACGVASVFVRPLFGAFSDRLKATAGAFACSLALFCGCLAALFMPRVNSLAAVYPLLLAAGSCANGVLPAAFARERYGREGFSAAISRFSPMTAAAAALSNPIGGLVFDLSGGYNILWFGCMGLSILSFMLLFMGNRNQTL